MRTLAQHRRAPVFFGRYLLCLPLALSALPLGCVASGGQTGDEFGSMEEDGPAIDERRIRVEVDGSDVKVVGEEGAVEDNAEVVVTNVDSGVTVRGKADADGAFELSIAGDGNDEFELSVTGEQGSLELRPETEAPTTTSTETEIDATETETTAEETSPETEAEGTDAETTTEQPEPSADAGSALDAEAQAIAEFEAYVLENSFCSDNDECALVSPGCPLGCVASVHVDAKAATEALAEELGTELRETGSGCTYDCPDPGQPVCSQGHCSYSGPNAPPTADILTLCEETGGTWEGVCGHFTCGEVPLTQCASGGCNCGPTGTFGDGGCTFDPSCDADFELSLEGEYAYPTSAYTQCEADSDCVLVGDSCSSCCTQSAVNLEYELRYQHALGFACQDYLGGECDCQAPEREARCEAGECRAVEL